MKTNYLSRLRYGMAALITSSLLTLNAFAQEQPQNYKQDPLYAETVKLWTNCEASVKKIAAEKNNHAAAEMMRKFDNDYTPQLELLSKKAALWRKSHTKQEYVGFSLSLQKAPIFNELMGALEPEAFGPRDKEFAEAYMRGAEHLHAAMMKGMSAAK